MAHFLKQIALAALLILIGASMAFASTGNLNIPPGTALTVRMNEHLNSEETNPGDSFHGVLASAVIVNHRKVLPKGASRRRSGQGGAFRPTEQSRRAALGVGGRPVWRPEVQHRHANSSYQRRIASQEQLDE